MTSPNELFVTTVKWERAILQLYRLCEAANLSDLDGKIAYLMVSVKNPHFSKALLRIFCDIVKAHSCRGEIVIFDSPYADTIAATNTDGKQRALELQKLKIVTAEKERLIERQIAQHSAPLLMRSFNDIKDAVDPSWVREVRLAFLSGGPFRRAVLQRTREVVSTSITEERVPLFAEFLVSEIPVLCHLYYARGAPGTVDFYPGENAQLLWDIERGLYEHELPKLSRAVQRSPRVVYVNVQQYRNELASADKAGRPNGGSRTDEASLD